MRFGGFYNFSGSGGTEEITGGADSNIPSFTENVCANDSLFFSGDFTNLSRELLHITLRGFGTTAAFHKHDLRAYETLRCINIPIREIGIHVPTGSTVGFHGMGTLIIPEDEDEYAVTLAKASLTESLNQAPNFNTDVYTSTTITTATDTIIMTPSTNTSLGLYKVTVACAGANTVQLKWTDTAGTGGFEIIGLLRFGAEGTFVYDFDPAMLRNPNGQNGQLMATTSTTASTQIDCIGHYIKASQ